MLIIDSITYNGEPILELRLKYLYDTIDIFIITECIYTNTGFKKKFFYFEKYIDNFTYYLDKIIYIKINNYPEKNDNTFNSSWYYQYYNDDKCINNWFKEYFNRNIVIDYLKKNINEEYILFVCDCDEIVNKNLCIELKNNYNYLDNILFINLNIFYYNLNYKSNDLWLKVFCINNNYVNNNNNINLSLIRTQTNISDFNFINNNNLGWHFCSFLTLKNIKLKLLNGAHQEINNKNYSNKFIRNCIKNGIVFYDLTKLEPSNYINSNLDNIIIEFHNNLINKQLYIFTDYINNNIFFELKKQLNEYIDLPNYELLEIGCNEGELTLWLLNNIITNIKSNITCLDLFNDIEKYHNFIFNLDNNNRIYLFTNITNFLIKKVYLNKTYNIIIINNIIQYDNYLLILSLSLELINKINGKIIIIDNFFNIKKITNLFKTNKYLYYITN